MASAIKPERNRVHRSEQTGVDQTKSRINPAAETRSRPQVMRRMPVSRHSVPKRLDMGTKQRHHAGEGILLKENRLWFLS
jgi:hypothetical protein